MKIVSWNVNSVNVRKPLLKKLIEEFKPEVICLQETKTDNNSFPTNFFEKKIINVVLMECDLTTV